MRNHAPAIAVLVLAALGGTFLSAAPARAAQLGIFESVEPPFVEGPYIFKNQGLGQSFTATKDYRLSRIETMVYDLDPNYPFGPFDPMNLTVQADGGGIPSGTVLATARADGDYGYAWLTFDLTAPLNVTMGQVYWIVLEDTNGMNQNAGYKWAAKGSDAYSGGAYAIRGGGGAWVNPSPPDDLLFRNWGLDGPVVSAGITVDSSTAGIWDPLTYVMCFNNTGTSAASYVWANVSLSPNTTYLSDTAGAVGGISLAPFSWQFTDVGVGPHSFQLNARVEPGIFDGLPMTATLQIEYANRTEQTQERTTASVTVIARAPSLAVSKSVTPRFLRPAQNLTYTISFVNSGARPSPWAWVNDTLPPEVTYVADTANALANFTSESFDGTTLHVLLTNLAQGAYSFDINARANLGLFNGTAFTNTVAVDFADTRGRLIVPSPTASAVARIGGASIQVANSANVTAASPGSEVLYRIRYDNRGNATARRVWINDTLPPEVEYVANSGGGVPGGGVVRFAYQNVTAGLHSLTVTVRVRNGTADGTRIRNVVDLSHTDWDGSQSTPSQAFAEVVAIAPILELQISGPTLANPGDWLDVAARVANLGSATAQAAWVNLTLPAELARGSDNASLYGGSTTSSGWRFSGVGPGSFAFGVRIRVAPGLANGVGLNVTASLDFADALGHTTTAPSSTLFVGIVAPAFDFAVAVDRPTVQVGDAVGFILRYGNTGAGVAADVWINVTVPAGVSVVNASEPWIATSGLRYIWHETGVGIGIRELRLTLRPESGRTPGTILIAAQLAFTDANGNPGGTVAGSASFEAVSFARTAQTWAFLLLLTAVATLCAVIGYRVYGLGSRDRAQILQLFLLHKSGLLVKHYTRTLNGTLDTDIVGAMLVAVQNFVRESFPLKAGDLEEMSFADHKILLVHGKDVILAALVSGRYLDRLKGTLRNGIERLEREYGDALCDWNGIVADLPGMDQLMDQILGGRTPSRTSGGLPVR